MISIQPPTVDAGERNADQKTDEKTKRRIPLASIPTTISIGLLVAAMYLGGRILTARRVAKPAVAVMSSATPVTAKRPDPPAPTAISIPASVVKPAPQTSKVDADDNSLTRVTPQPGQRYIQVGALDMDAAATHRFVERLRGEKLDPHIAPGPSPALMRVLIGPFDNLDALNEKKAQLETEGIQTFVRKY